MISKPNLHSYLRIALAAALVAYLVVALSFTSQMSSMRLCRGMKVEVRDTLKNGFVKAAEIEKELGSIFTEAKGKRIADISLHEIEQRLARIDKIESVNARALTNDSIIVEVTPMAPAIRVYDRGMAYYVNREGKRITCDARYSMDVPVVAGNFADDNPTDYIELATRIERDPQWRELVSMIKVDSPRDIYLIPDIRGQVIAFGSTANIDNKLHRLDKFYREVLPHKGWNYYDTISVKWDGQLVATKARKAVRQSNIVVDESDDLNDYDNLGLDQLVDTTVLVAKNSNNTPNIKKQHTN